MGESKRPLAAARRRAAASSRQAAAAKAPARRARTPRSRPVIVMAGTRKGAFLVKSDAARRRWTVEGPLFEGAKVFHMVQDPRRPGDLYAAVNSDWWGLPLQFRQDSSNNRFD